MKQSELFTKTLKADPKDEVSVNAKLLERGGFVYKNSAGIYSFLPLGWRVIQKIAEIIREEMNAIGGQEIFMPALVEKKYLDATGRWDVEVGFEVRGKKEKNSNFVLGWTHEEVLTEIASKQIGSYEDLPFSAYQIQTKFRNEARAKSGILRGREFMMKDLYSFHASEEDLMAYYEKVARAYEKIFRRVGLKATYTLAAGGAFTASHTHEFQVAAPVGEDTIFVCAQCNYSENSEISKLKDKGECPKCEGEIQKLQAIEVGNIFPLGTKYSEAFNLHFLNKKGERELVVMGSYGIGLGRLMGTIVEVWHDDRGILWPESVSPFDAHLLLLGDKDPELQKYAEGVYNNLQKAGVSVLFDDRSGVAAGEKFFDADMMGMPIRLVVSEKTLVQEKIEVKKRNEKEAKLMKLDELIELVNAKKIVNKN